MSGQERVIAVTGAGGFVGRHVVRELLGRGVAVRALVRNQAAARKLFGSPLPKDLSFVQGDICDASALDELCAGASACVHLVGIIREARGEDAQQPQTFDRMHVHATQAITDACERNNVKRYVHMSALGVGPEGKSAYQKTKWQAELIVRRTGLDWTIVRPSLIHGADGEFVRMMNELCSGSQPPFVFVPYFVRIEMDKTVPLGAMSFVPAKIAPIAVEDVALAIAESLERSQAIGEVYNLVGPETLDWQQLTEFFRDTLPKGNKSLGTWYMPGEHMAMIATAASKVGLGGLLPFDAGQAIMATQDSTADMTKATLDLGLKPRAFRRTVRAYAGSVH